MKKTALRQRGASTEGPEAWDVPWMRQRVLAVSRQMGRVRGAWMKLLRCQVHPEQSQHVSVLRVSEGAGGPTTVKFQVRDPERQDMWVEVDLLTLKVHGSLGALAGGGERDRGYFATVVDISDACGELACFRVVHSVCSWFELVVGMSLRPDDDDDKGQEDLPD